MDERTDLLIVGAGPFGLALSAYARRLGIEHVVVGEPMSFWRAHMPDGMYLRSDSDWHLDVAGEATIDAYTASLGRTRRDVEPLSLDYYRDYVRWFQRATGISTREVLVNDIRQDADGFAASLSDGSRLQARRVVLALGFGYFAHVPPETASLLPEDSYAHTCDAVDLAQYAGRRVLIVGGRQSAFEWAALLCDHGAAAVHLSYRHDTPTFAAADWSWVLPLMDDTVRDPGWYRRLRTDEQQELQRRLWAEGRLKLEPWLASRIDDARVTLWPRTSIAACAASPEGLRITLDPAGDATIDDVIFATGYKVDLARVPLLTMLLPKVEMRDGAPVLTERFESSVPGLYFTSMAATRDFGPFLAFTVSARASARIIGDDVARSLAAAVMHHSA
jgi:cation diffusion facilitator CzcD-associated flavoprotein CzcO